MPASHLTRRGLLGAAAGAAAAYALPAGLAPDPTRAAELPPVDVGPGLTPEVVTVTDTSIACWWPTDAPADSELVVTPVDAGGTPTGAPTTRRVDEARTVHAVTVDGLQPGTRYAYEMRSAGVRQAALLNGEADPGVVTTLTPPSGRRLARIGLLNDLHVGEHCSGTISTLPDGTSFPPCNSAEDFPDYAFRMDAAAIRELAGLDLDLLVVNGDLSDRGRDEDIRRCLELMRSIGVPTLITRGNHDRRLAGECAPDGDCLRAQAFPGQAVGDSPLRSVARVGDRVAVVGLDSADPETGRGRLDLDDQPAWLDARLTELEAEGRDVVVAFHHPIIAQTQPPSVSDRVDLAKGGNAVLDVLARHPYVRLVVGGHTHRNNLGRDTDRGGAIPFLENGAIKEYPAGYALLDVHEGGIMRTFHRPVDDFTRTWVQVSAGQVFGNHATITRGDLTSRAFVVSYESRGDRPGTSTAPETAPAPTTTAPAAPAPVAAGAQLTGTAAVPAPPARAEGPLRLGLDRPRRARLSTVLRRGLPLTLRTPEAADVEVVLRAGGRTLAKRTIRVEGERRLRLRVTPAEAKRLRRARRSLTASLELRAARPHATEVTKLERPVELVV